MNEKYNIKVVDNNIVIIVPFRNIKSTAFENVKIEISEYLNSILDAIKKKQLTVNRPITKVECGILVDWVMKSVKK